MKRWTTELTATDREGNLFTWVGQVITAPSWQLAEEYCEKNGLGYLRITGELIAEVPCDKNLKPD